ncbi:MAG: toprim domain-containing protein [Gaiellaceae bacterium]
MERTNPRDFYTEVVLPALQERLDSAFPEFGWKRDRLGWVAANQEFTHGALGVRAERVVAHGPAPRGFLVHGGEATLWTAYVSGGATPRGQEFVRAVREIAERAGVDTTPLERDQPRDRRAELLGVFVTLSQRELASERGASARAYLERRGLPVEALTGLDLGVVPAPKRTRAILLANGYSQEEITDSGVLADSRWPGRVLGPWRDARGQVKTLWARVPDDAGEASSRYLYLRGASRTGLPPCGLSDILAGSYENRRDVVLVEGVFDLLQLRVRGIGNVGALGGTAARPELFERLARLRIETVTLCLDNDEAGRTATARAIEQAARAKRSPAILVLDPHRLTPAKDADAFVRARGAEPWRALLERRECGIGWRALELLGDTKPDSPMSARREALSRAGAWLGSLPARLTLEQEDAVTAAAERCGYTPDAVQRAFRACYWEHEHTPKRSLQTERWHAFARER